MANFLEDLKAATTPEPKPEPVAPKVAMTMAERFKALDRVGKQLDKQFSTTSSLVRLGSKVGEVRPSIGTGLLTLDHDVLGCGGIPRGRIIEFFGEPACGKTSLSLHIAAQEQARGNVVAFVDMEHALDPTYAATFGVNVDDLYVSQPNSGEEAVETIQALVLSGAVSLIILDSVAAMVPQVELDGESGQSHMGVQGRMMSQACRKLVARCATADVAVIFINQIRDTIGGYGPSTTTTGGRALKFFSSVRLDIRKVAGDDGWIKNGTAILGQRTKIKAVKNKVGLPFRETIVDLVYNQGFDMTSDMIEYATQIGVVTQSGAWFYLSGEKVSQGRAKLKEAIKNDPAMLAKVTQAVELARAAKEEPKI